MTFVMNGMLNSYLMVPITNSFFQVSIKSKLSKIGFRKKNRFMKNLRKGVCPYHKPKKILQTKIEVYLTKFRRSTSYPVLITRLISCVFLLLNFFCTTTIMNYFHITKLNYRQGDRPYTEKQKVIFFGK